MTREADALFSTPEITALFADGARVERILRFEVALARAQVRAGIVPTSAAEAIEGAASSLTIDPEALFREGALSASAIVPLVRLLREAAGADAARYVHMGATSQDAIDSATMLQVHAGLELVDSALLEVAEACARLSVEHRDTPMAGRTLLQQAVPVTFGLKAARWLAMATRQIEAVRAVRERCIALQFGGAAGTLSALGNAGPSVSAYLAEELELPEPSLPWHTERDRIAEVASALGTVAGAMGKIGQDLALLAQTEVGETSEGGDGGRSSAMPQKRNPVHATLAVSSARLAVAQVPVLLDGMMQAHERAAGQWQAEWAALPDLFRYTAGAVAHAQAALANLQVHEERMRDNLGAAQGTIMAESLTAALSTVLGRAEATRLVEASVLDALTQSVTLREAAGASEAIRAVLDEAALDAALDPSNYLGSASVFIDRAMEDYRALIREA